MIEINVNEDIGGDMVELLFTVGDYREADDLRRFAKRIINAVDGIPPGGFKDGEKYRAGAVLLKTRLAGLDRRS